MPKGVIKHLRQNDPDCELILYVSPRIKEKYGLEYLKTTVDYLTSVRRARRPKIADRSGHL